MYDDIENKEEEKTSSYFSNDVNKNLSIAKKNILQRMKHE